MLEWFVCQRTNNLSPLHPHPSCSTSPQCLWLLFDTKQGALNEHFLSPGRTPAFCVRSVHKPNGLSSPCTFSGFIATKKHRSMIPTHLALTHCVAFCPLDDTPPFGHVSCSSDVLPAPTTALSPHFDQVSNASFAGYTVIAAAHWPLYRMSCPSYPASIELLHCTERPHSPSSSTVNGEIPQWLLGR